MLKTPKQKKFYRPKSGQLVTVSMTLSNAFVESIAAIIKNDPEQNMSNYIEENISPHLPYTPRLPSRRKYGSYPIKKTFTFTKEFVDKLREYRNISILIESILS